MGMDETTLSLCALLHGDETQWHRPISGGITCSAITEDLTDKAIDEITKIIRRNHKLKDGTDTQDADDDDFNIRSREELASMMNSNNNRHDD